MKEPTKYKLPPVRKGIFVNVDIEEAEKGSGVFIPTYSPPYYIDRPGRGINDIKRIYVISSYPYKSFASRKEIINGKGLWDKIKQGAKKLWRFVKKKVIDRGKKYLKDVLIPKAAETMTEISMKPEKVKDILQKNVKELGKETVEFVKDEVSEELREGAKELEKAGLKMTGEGIDKTDIKAKDVGGRKKKTAKQTSSSSKKVDKKTTQKQEVKKQSAKRTQPKKQRKKSSKKELTLEDLRKLWYS